MYTTTPMPTINPMLAYLHDDDDVPVHQHTWVNPMLRYPTRPTTTKEEG